MSEKYLSGAFSPFTIALQNIRDNLLSKKDSKKDSEDIRYAYLQEIITLSIPIHTETKGGSTALEFPVAACWKNKSEDKVIFHYAGQYTPGDFGDFKEIEEAKRITDKIRNKIIEYQKQRSKDPKAFDKLPECPFADSEIHATEYPESLRKIKGCWQLDCDDLRFLVFFTYVPDSIENPIGQDDRERIRESFKSCFLSEDAYKYLTRITSIEPNEHHKYEKKDKKGYLVLRDILSNIKRSIDIIAQPDKSKDENSTGIEVSTSEDELKKIFSVVFVLPTFMEQDDKVSFRYVLTHQQIRYLKDKEKTKDVVRLIRKKENKVLEDLWESHEKYFPDTRIKADCFGEDSSKQLKVLINNLRDNLNYDGYGKINKHKRGEVEELLRKAIYAYYAFAPKTKTEFSQEMSGRGMAEYIESDRGTVRSKQTVLIRHIFNSRSPDVVENFINHPLSKRCKRTNYLIEHMEEDDFYPRALHLFERIFFPKRFFMYPLYQYGTPVLLCAFNADSYLESRQSLKGTLDRHIQGIFSAILNYELSQANESFAIMTSWSDTKAIKQFKRKIRQLLLRFCPEIEKIENIELMEKSAADVNYTVVTNNEWEFNVSIPKLITIQIPLRDDTKQLLTASCDGQQILYHYLELYAEAFARFRKIAELSRSEEAHQWAHSMVARIDIMSGYVNRFLLSPYEELNARIALFKKELDKLSKYDWDTQENPVETLLKQIDCLTENYWLSLDFGINLEILKGMIVDLNLQLDSLKKFHSYSHDDIDRAYGNAGMLAELFEVIGIAMYYSLFRMLISTHIDYVNARKRILKTHVNKDRLLRTLVSRGKENNLWEHVNEFAKTNTNLQLTIGGSIEEGLKIPAIHSEIYIMLVEELLLNAIKYGQDIEAILELDGNLSPGETGFAYFKIRNRIVKPQNQMGQGVGIVFRTARKYKPDFTEEEFTEESNGYLKRKLPIKIKR